MPESNSRKKLVSGALRLEMPKVYEERPQNGPENNVFPVPI